MRFLQPDSASTYHDTDSLPHSLLKQLKIVNGYPVLKRGLESSIPGLHFVGKPAAWSFGPLLGFVSGAEFASTEVVRCIANRNGH